MYENIVKLLSLLHLEKDLDNLEDNLTNDLNSMEALIQCAKHQNRIVDDVLQLGKLSMNLISIRKTPFDPLIEVKACIQRFDAVASAKGIEVKVSGNSGWVRGDPIRYAQVLLNLLSNAIRFTENAPTRGIDVSIEASVDSIFLITSVIDSGVGMEREELRELVQKLDSASTRTYVNYGGSGLGLFISKILVEAHGGRLSIESEKNKGTKVTFYILVEKLSKRLTTSVLQPSIPSAPKTIHVLIVEDNLVSLNHFECNC